MSLILYFLDARNVPVAFKFASLKTKKKKKREKKTPQNSSLTNFPLFHHTKLFRRFSSFVGFPHLNLHPAIQVYFPIQSLLKHLLTRYLLKSLSFSSFLQFLTQ
jgi:hypothetical protein